jgi:pimeloyl-ACP methyl ester carboxylesterase
MRIAQHRTGSGEPLLLIHGIGSQWQMWEPVIDVLARAHEVVAIDLPGFGDSPPLEGARPTVAALADAVAGLGLDRPHVVGNSLGGGVALELGARGLARSVCALSPIGFGTRRERAYASAVLRGSRLAARGLAPMASPVMASRLTRTVIAWHLIARPWRMSAEAGAGALRALAGATAFEATLRATLQWDACAPRCPTTIAWGEHDRVLLFSRQSRRARRLLPGAEHVVLRGCGHVPTWDDPELVSRVIRNAAHSHSQLRVRAP